MVTLSYLFLPPLFSEMKFLFLYLIVLALSANVVESEECSIRGKLRSDPFSTISLCDDYNCDTIQVCTNITGSLEWTNICYDEDWDQNSINVYCRQFGYSGANSVSGGLDGVYRSYRYYGDNEIKLSNVDCVGDELNLLSCVYTTRDSACRYPLYDPSTHCFSSSVVTSTAYSNTFFPSTYTVQATSIGIPSTTSTTPSSSLSTQSVASTQQSRMSLMLIPILVPIIAILVILTILTIVILVLSCIFCSRRKRTKGSIDNDETTMYAELSGIPSLNSKVENHNTVIINGDPNYTAINETSLMDRDHAYAEIGKRTLDSEDVQEYLAPINDNYSSIDNELYGHLVEGEVSNYNLYEQLPRMDQEAYHKLVAISSTLENPLYDILVKESPNEEPIYIDPPSSLPQLENVFGQCLNEIRRKDIQMGEEFASGQFGVVYRAVYHTEKGDIPVAIKTLKEAANTDTKVAFMREAAILAQFQHPNVLRMIGVLTTQQPYMMVTELLKTELADLLLKMKSADPTHRQNLPPLLLRFCQEIAAGMKHLSEKHFIHRDLAARNVLVAKDLSCRIADFGMSRELHSDSEYYTSSGGRVPLRWTAPEAVFYNKYSEKSDVWSFGMTMYEIWSLGDKPWGLYTSNEEIVGGMSQGKKLSPPTGCPRDVYRVMVETWRADASVRPTFSDAQVMLTDIQLPPLIPGVNEPSLCLGNDPVLAQDLYLDLQLVK